MTSFSEYFFLKKSNFISFNIHVRFLSNVHVFLFFRLGSFCIRHSALRLAVVNDHFAIERLYSVKESGQL